MLGFWSSLWLFFVEVNIEVCCHFHCSSSVLFDTILLADWQFLSLTFSFQSHIFFADGVLPWFVFTDITIKTVVLKTPDNRAVKIREGAGKQVSMIWPLQNKIKYNHNVHFLTVDYQMILTPIKPGIYFVQKYLNCILIHLFIQPGIPKKPPSTPTYSSVWNNHSLYCLSNSLATVPNPGVVMLINVVHVWVRVFGWRVMPLRTYILSEEAHGFAVAPPGTIWPFFLLNRRRRCVCSKSVVSSSWQRSSRFVLISLMQTT